MNSINHTHACLASRSFPVLPTEICEARCSDTTKFVLRYVVFKCENEPGGVWCCDINSSISSSQHPQYHVNKNRTIADKAPRPIWLLNNDKSCASWTDLLRQTNILHFARPCYFFSLLVLFTTHCRGHTNAALSAHFFVANTNVIACHVRIRK